MYVFAILFIVAPGLLADVYVQRTQATIGAMTSQTVATLPTNRARTTIGIGEEVTCSINPATWSDLDCNLTKNRIESDTIGDRVWACGPGGTINPSGITSSNSTTLTASDSPGSPRVLVNVYDSENKYDDSPLTRSIPFSVIAPSGMTSTLYSDNYPGTLGPPDNKIGASSVFICTVSPTTVNFYNAEMRENIPGDNWTWPDGTNDSRPWAMVFWSTTTISGTQNRTTDTITEYGNPIGRLDNDPTPNVNYVNHSHTVRVPEDYKNKYGSWTSWLSGETHPRHYRGSDQKARVQLHADNDSYGTWRGPWQ